MKKVSDILICFLFKTFVFLFLLTNNTIAFADGYSPEVGTNIYFYPVNDWVKERILGFDCFYDAGAYKKEAYKFSPKNRFNANSSSLTDFSEIEDKLFHVDKIDKTEYKKRSYYVMHLTRADDTASLIFAIPFFPNKVDNDLTRSMIFQTNNGFSFNNTVTSTVIIPCIEELNYRRLKTIVGNGFAADKSLYIHTGFRKDIYGDYELYDYIERIIEKTDTKKSPSSYNGLGQIKHVNWKNCSMFYFKHLFADIDINGQTFSYPIYEHLFRGGTFCFDEYFIDQDRLLQKLEAEINAKHLIRKYSGRTVYYGLKKDIINTSFLYTPELEKTQISKGYYTCEGYDLYSINDRCQLMFKLKDQQGITVLSKFEHKGPYSSYTNKGDYNFEDFFVTEDEAKKHFEEVDAKNKREAETYRMWVKQYGKKAADYLQKAEYSREDFYKYAKKWGVSVALDICKGYVRIGWDQEKCRLSWGRPEDINRSTGSWGVHEQWCYNGSYLYFENGRLTSIQN